MTADTEPEITFMLLTSRQGLIGILENGYRPHVYISLWYTFICWSHISKNEGSSRTKWHFPALMLCCFTRAQRAINLYTFFSSPALPSTHQHWYTLITHTSTHTLVSVLFLQSSCSAPGSLEFMQSCARNKIQLNGWDGTWNNQACGDAVHPTWHRLSQEMI